MPIISFAQGDQRVILDVNNHATDISFDLAIETLASLQQYGMPFALRFEDNKIWLDVWQDPEDEEPTHKIMLRPQQGD